MRVWTNGTFARVWMTGTIYRYRDGSLRVEETLKKVKGAEPTSADEVVAWASKGARLDPALEKKRRKVIDAVCLDEERIASVISEGRSGPRLVIGPPKGPFELDLALKGREVKTVAWPAGLWDEGAAPVSTSDKPSGGTHRGVRVHANAHGVGMAGGESGHVFLFRHGNEDLTSAFRVPSEEGGRIDAVPSELGLIVTLVRADGNTQVVHLTEDGESRGVWPKEPVKGGVATLRLDDDKALAFDAAEGALVLLALPDLSELTREPLSEPLVDMSAGPKGSVVVVADDAGLYDVTVDDEAVSVDGPYLFEEASKTAAAEDSGSRYDPVRASGPPQVAFPAGKKLPKDPPWSLPLSKETAIPMRFRSGAEPGKGIHVAVSGAAVDKGLVRPVAVTANGARCELAREGNALVGVLPEVELVQGIQWPLDPKPQRDDDKEASVTMMNATHFGIEVHFEGLTAGSELMTVVVGAHESAAAPLKRTRPITVE
ncbi:MAG: hypothetical protein AB8I08_22385 [Sandaracinaceae bacterium]